MILCEEPCEFLDKIAQNLSPKDIELVFINDEEMKKLNKTQRGIDKSTDVLSFPLENVDEHLPLGCIAINLDLAKEKSKELGHSLNDELSLLFIHAMLHLLGFDHETDNGEMRQTEKEWIEFFKLPQSLIMRSETQVN